MCTRVGTRPCPVCRSLGWRPPQRGKRRPRPPTHGQLPSLLLKPKNLKKSGPGFVGSRVERAGPKRTRHPPPSRLCANLGIFFSHFGIFFSHFTSGPSGNLSLPLQRRPRTSARPTVPTAAGAQGPGPCRALPADPDPPPPLPPEERPEGRPRLQAASPASSAPPQRDGKLLRPTGSGGPGPGLSSRPSCPLLPRLLQAKRPRRRFSHVPHRVPPRRPLQGLAPPAHAALRRLLGYLLLLRVRSNVTFRANILHTPKPSGNPCHWGKWGDVFSELKTGFHWRWGNDRAGSKVRRRRYRSS